MCNINVIFFSLGSSLCVVEEESMSFLGLVLAFHILTNILKSIADIHNLEKTMQKLEFNINPQLSTNPISTTAIQANIKQLTDTRLFCLTFYGLRRLLYVISIKQ